MVAEQLCGVPECVDHVPGHTDHFKWTTVWTGWNKEGQRTGYAQRMSVTLPAIRGEFEGW